MQGPVVSLPERDFNLRKAGDVRVGEIVNDVLVGGIIFVVVILIEFANNERLQTRGFNEYPLKFGVVTMLYLDV